VASASNLQMQEPKITECYLAVLKNQRMVSNARIGGVPFWALTASICIHLGVLTAFAFVKFSQSEAKTGRGPLPMAKVSRVEKLMQADLVTPKPKVKRPAKNRSPIGTDRLSLANQIFEAAKPGSHNCANLARAFAPAGELSLPSGAGMRRVEFFGSFTDRRKVCYVVDCSGSMWGVFSQVRKKLAESIASLQADQYFCIIFFGADRLFEFGQGCLVRATGQVKSAAYEFIDSVQPAGKTNTLAALERAVQIRDSCGQGPAVIYFLTDGFELAADDEQRFLWKIANLLARFAPTTTINTIGFATESAGRRMLKTIAKQSGGEFVFVDDF